VEICELLAQYDALPLFAGKHAETTPNNIKKPDDIHFINNEYLVNFL
jgi:hypothetical protein